VGGDPRVGLGLHVWIGQAEDVVSAASRAPLSAPLPLCSEIAPLLETAYCETALPISNVFAPCSETESEMVLLVLAAFNRSAQRRPSR